MSQKKIDWSSDVISFAIGELKCPSLDYVYAMTWAEFRIRLHAWRRQTDRELYLLRELAWATYIAPHQDPKKMKKTKESFWSLGGKKKQTVTHAMRQRIKAAQKEYFDEKENLNKSKDV